MAYTEVDRKVDVSNLTPYQTFESIDFDFMAWCLGSLIRGADLYQYALKRISMIRISPNWVGYNLIEVNSIDSIELKWIILNWIELNRT